MPFNLFCSGGLEIYRFNPLGLFRKRKGVTACILVLLSIAGVSRSQADTWDQWPKVCKYHMVHNYYDTLRFWCSQVLLANELFLFQEHVFIHLLVLVTESQFETKVDFWVGRLSWSHVKKEQIVNEPGRVVYRLYKGNTLCGAGVIVQLIGYLCWFSQLG